MPRPQKQHTVAYFPHYVHTPHAVTILETRFGNDGWAFWYKLQEMLCDNAGQSIDLNRRSYWDFLVDRMKSSEDMVRSMFDTLAELDVIDQLLYRDGVVWMQCLVDDLSELYKKRVSGPPARPEARNRAFDNPTRRDFAPVGAHLDDDKARNRAKAMHGIEVSGTEIATERGDIRPGAGVVLAWPDSNNYGIEVWRGESAESRFRDTKERKEKKRKEEKSTSHGTRDGWGHAGSPPDGFVEKRDGERALNENFILFYSSYPRKRCRQEAMKAFRKLSPDQDLMALLMAAVERDKHSEQWNRDDGRFIPYPATWLNGRRWDDEPNTGGDGNGKPQGRRFTDAGAELDNPEYNRALARHYRVDGALTNLSNLQGDGVCVLPKT
jgi:hypothetical protein